jgi:hypothetical protein
MSTIPIFTTKKRGGEKGLDLSKIMIHTDK